MDGSLTQTSPTLLNRVAEGGDAAAGGEFVARYSVLVRSMAATAKLPPEDIDDVAQEVMLAAIEGLREHRYDRELGRFKMWLKGVVYHKISDARGGGASRGKPSAFSHQPSASSEEESNPTSFRTPHYALRTLKDPRPSPAEQFEADFEAEWQKVAFAEALDEVRRELDPMTFQAFDLYARKNLPVREVCSLLGLSRNAVYIAKNRVLERVRAKLS